MHTHYTWGERTVAYASQQRAAPLVDYVRFPMTASDGAPTLNLPRSYAEAIIQHAREDYPNECCGILAYDGDEAVRHYRITNVEQSPYRYSMDGKELFGVYREIEDNGWELKVIYHSHTHSAAYPSATDVRLATWPDAYYMLVSLMDQDAPDIRNFSIVDGEIEEVALTIGD